MYDVNERKKFRNFTIAEFTEQLQALPQDAKLLICGEDMFFIHVEKDKSVVCIDTEDLEDLYIDDKETSPDDFWNNRSLLEQDSTIKIPYELGEMLTQFEEQKKVIYDHYVCLVASVISGHISTENEIERIMDGLIDFGDDERFLALYKKLCRHVFHTYPQMVGEHINLLRLQFEEKDEQQ